MKQFIRPSRLRNLLLLLVLFTLPQVLWSQNSYRQSGDSYLTVAGTSTLHDWTMTTKEPQVQVAFDIANGVITQVKNLNVTVACQSLKSAHNAMDKNAYSSLKADKFKTITFKIASATVQGNAIQCTGSLFISGVTKNVTVSASYEVKPDGTINVTGSMPIKMSDYQVEPPTFMFGSVKTGNDVKVSFNLQLSPIKV
jgi:polyisoprenoid-binding protein YceI